MTRSNPIDPVTPPPGSPNPPPRPLIRPPRISSATVMGILLLAAAAASAYDLHRVETHTLVIYTTPALRDAVEKVIAPAYRAATGQQVQAIYELSAGEEYNRVRLSRDRPEADVFLHASPLFLERGHASDPRYFTPLPRSAVAPIPAAELANWTRAAPDGVLWFAFAWSPLVEVWPRSIPQQPDLATSALRFGMPQPRLSNNGVYTTAFFEALDPGAGRHALNQTVVQPTSARTSVGGVADGSFDITLGYEAVARLYASKGASISFDVPLLAGERASARVLFAAALVANHPHAGAERFLQVLLTPAVQDHLQDADLRPVHGAPLPGGVRLEGVRMVEIDWSRWAELEQALARYEVNS